MAPQRFNLVLVSPSQRREVRPPVVVRHPKPQSHQQPNLEEAVRHSLLERSQELPLADSPLSWAQLP
jgi:hypothetical protein